MTQMTPGPLIVTAGEMAVIRKVLDAVSAPPPWDERIAELLTENNQFRALLGEILATFQDHWPSGAVAVVLPPVITAWRERAGLTEGSTP